jgi:hypothetical protein
MMSKELDFDWLQTALVELLQEAHEIWKLLPRTDLKFKQALELARLILAAMAQHPSVKQLEDLQKKLNEILNVLPDELKAKLGEESNHET